MTIDPPPFSTPIPIYPPGVIPTLDVAPSADAEPLEIQPPMPTPRELKERLRMRLNQLVGHNAVVRNDVEWSKDEHHPLQFDNDPVPDSPLSRVTLRVGFEWLRAEQPEVFSLYILLRLQGASNPFPTEGAGAGASIELGDDDESDDE